MAQKALELFGDAGKVDELDSSWEDNEEKKYDAHIGWIESEITSWRKSLGNKLFNKIFACFTCLSKNPEDASKGEAYLFITENSLVMNLPR